MYTEFFGLSEKPFSITPDPRYLYLSGRHAEALAHLLYGVTESGGFIQLTGEVGTGKTTLVRSLLEQLPEQAQIALVLNPRLSPMEFLQVICDELGCSVAHEQRQSGKALVDALNRHLLTAHAAGRRVILIVDEAQNLSAEVLEQLRLLTNLETAKQKLLQIILIGQEELRDLLARNDLRQLAQRITGRYHLEPLDRADTAAYVRHRVSVAGGSGDLFSRRALKTIHAESGGIPRLINVIADRALLGAWSAETRQVSAALARAAAREVRGAETRDRRWPWVLMSAFGVASVAVAVWLGLQTSRQATPVPVASRAAVATPAATRPAATAESPAPARAAPVVQPPAATAGSAEAPARSASGPRPEDRAPPAPRLVPQPDPSPPTLRELLAARSSQTATSTALAGLVGLWGVTPPSGLSSCDVLRADGLRCHFQRGTWSGLVRLNRPAILALTSEDGGQHQIVLVSVTESGDPVIKLGEERFTVPLADLVGMWTGDALIIWRPEAGDGRTLSMNAVGEDVLWLRRSLSRVIGAAVPPVDSDLYDEPLAASVRDFQRSQRLNQDGIAGALTLISLNDVLGLNGRPQLRPET
jgi:general secretion pathway protein A